MAQSLVILHATDMKMKICCVLYPHIPRVVHSYTHISIAAFYSSDIVPSTVLESRKLSCKPVHIQNTYNTIVPLTPISVP